LVQLVATVGVWGLYFLSLNAQMGRGFDLPSFPDRSLGLFIGGVVLLIVVAIVLALLARIGSTAAEHRVRDEREALAGLRAFKWAYVVGALLLVWVGWQVWSTGAQLSVLFDAQPANGGVSMSFLPSMLWVPNTFVLIANHLLLCAVLTEVFRYALNIVLIRRLR
jgi:hypothetical protein